MKGKSASLIGAVIFTVLLVFSCLLLWFGLNHVDDEEDYLDPEYPVLTAADEVTTKQYPIEKCDSVRFFPNDVGDKRILFAGAIPSVKVVNSDAYYVELTANQTVQDAIVITVEDGVLVVDIHETCYASVYPDDVSYDYDKGLCLESTAFELTIYAPVSSFTANAKLSLDMEMASTDRADLRFSYDGVTASIRGIEANSLYLEAAGTSNLTLSGQVRSDADIRLWHNVHVDARSLKMGSLNARVSSRLFALSRIRYQSGWYINLLDIGTLTSLLLGALLAAIPLSLLTMDIRCLYRLFKRSA